MSATTRTPPARVSALRTLSLVLAFAAGIGLIFGTAGFTAMEADRGVAVNVTDDRSAYLGYEPLTDEVHDGESTAVVEYRNRFDGDLDEFDVSVTAPEATGVTVTDVDAPDSLSMGNASRVAVTLDCAREREVDLLFEADGSGDGVSVSLDRTHTVTCVPEGPTVTGVEFDGAANGNVTVRGTDGGVEANVWIAENPPAESVDGLTEVKFDGAETFDTAERIRPQVDATPRNWKIVAVEFPGQSVTYLHPGWNAGVYETPSAGDGVAYNGAVDEEFLLDASVENGEVVTGESEDGD
ncbi:hypothetical protein [Halorubrum salsamenti]|uniref:hypothetical protein n=1 Tax=Halorubrum salsamenti TaxID=2583990 RepID=UPI001F4F66AE|nr:hypothetical protein [Halorubrum salsamenti]